MIVYVETNFVLELTYDQEQAVACRGLLDRAATGRIDIALPAFSVAEARMSLAATEKSRKRFFQTIERELARMECKILSSFLDAERVIDRSS